MARQPALALARPHGVPALRGAWRRAVLIGVSILAALGLLYVGARETPVFALRTVEIQGAPPKVRQAVLRSVEETRGTSLVSLDGDAVVRRLEALPSVRSVSYDRAFPHTLRLVVVPEQPVAVVDQASNLWIVSVRGRVIGPTSAVEAADLPRLRYLPEAPLTAGQFVSDAGTKTILAALAEAPKRMPLPIHSARLEDGELTLVLAGEAGTRPLLLVGEPDNVGTKLRVAALVLRKLGADERAALSYLDVTLPDRPVASSNPLVSG
ncbi:MAG TPA: FtsQ-type POTRA domain-containing protein [Gaiellaceae bacterium]|nr:FtsQ-type POTRA domain-containing protein [Gaiellaceae bacterium]